MVGKRCLVTGGGSGIGLAIVKAFLSEGASVAACDKNPDVQQDVEILGASFTQCDVAKAEEVQQWVDSAARSLGGVDVVVAGLDSLPRVAPNKVAYVKARRYE